MVKPSHKDKLFQFARSSPINLDFDWRPFLFTKIFIANRGEIACRIIRTASRMGIKTVVVYSAADTNARHVRLADEAFLIGPSAPNESYLSQNAMIDALRESQADAVHPGYGFLSENSDFARSVANTGAVFIGPDPNAIAAMGDKIQSKKIAQEAGLHVIPGYLGEVKDAKHAIEIANDIAYPVMIKASSGGGGKGMRVAHNDDELKRSFELAQNEARTSFGDDRLLVERYIERPRHIEIQVLGDTHSNIVHLNERECSIQRRHQKVIEEAPSPFVDPDLRSRMGWQAVTFAKKVGYYSAGTVEFIVGSDKQFYFLEMNTRLQVEHPVTEMITGLDLVEQMIRVAAGERLQFSQEDIGIDGWAVETRIYAEDPERGFLPATGRLTRYLPPRETSTIRLDSGVEEGEEVSVFYDPMMGKLVTHGSDRETAISWMQTALHSFVIRGVAHNVTFLCAVLEHAKFKLGELTTDFIAEQYPDGFDATTFSKKTGDILVAVGALVHVIQMQRRCMISGRTDGGRYQPGANWVVSIGGEEFPVVVNQSANGCEVLFRSERLSVNGEWVPGAPLFVGQVGQYNVQVQIDPLLEGYCLTYGGARVSVILRCPRAAELLKKIPEKPPKDTSRFVLSPMPGRVVEISVRPGDSVKAGEELAVVDAMKMENVLCAERDGMVAEVLVSAGDSISVDQIILEMKPYATA